MQIELNIPASLEKKLKALYVLMDSNETLDDIVVDLMDEVVSMRITELVIPEPRKAEHAPKALQKKKYVPVPAAASLEDGLGDETIYGDDEEIPPPVEDMFELVPKGGASLKDLDDDMEVGDPEHEAKASAGDAMSPYLEGGAQEMFSQMMGQSHEELEVDPRITKRKKRLNIKGRVTPATSVEESF